MLAIIFDVKHRLSTDDDPTLPLAQLKDCLASVVAEINRNVPLANADHDALTTARLPPPIALTVELQQAIKPLLVQLMAALDLDNSTPVKKCLTALAQQLPTDVLSAILASVFGYDFRGAEAHVRQLASDYKVDLSE